MFNSSTWQSHTEYHNNFNHFLISGLSDDMLSGLITTYAAEHAKLMSLNLDSIGEYASQYYSDQGRPAKNQAQILRSYILFAFLFNRTNARLSLTQWIRDVLPNNPLFIALIGCSRKRDLPPLGSYFDFADRFWGDSREFSKD